ncbi:MAG TPA: hypothetical protein VGQ44_15795 [Gemmatimonadaceae bacterium]|jgi:hypothetical protein|nr:hypothetical protein [Gemmatimonadaceae bacterium]
MRAEFARVATVYRTQDSMKSVMPIGMLGMLLSMIALATLFAMMHAVLATSCCFIHMTLLSDSDATGLAWCQSNGGSCLCKGSLKSERRGAHSRILSVGTNRFA